MRRTPTNRDPEASCAEIGSRLVSSSSTVRVGLTACLWTDMIHALSEGGFHPRRDRMVRLRVLVLTFVILDLLAPAGHAEPIQLLSFESSATTDVTVGSTTDVRSEE